MLLNLRLRQLGLRPVDVCGQGSFRAVLRSYMGIPIITYSVDKLANVLLKAILRIHGMNL